MSIKPPKTYIVQKLDSGFLVTSDSQQLACANHQEASNVVTEFIRILDSTTKQTRISTGKDSLQFSIIAVSSKPPKFSPIQCCFVAPSGAFCHELASFQIIYGNSPSEVTESCSTHIGDLIQDDDVHSVTVRKLTLCPNCGSTQIEEGQDCHFVCQSCGKRWG